MEIASFIIGVFIGSIAGFIACTFVKKSSVREAETIANTLFAKQAQNILQLAKNELSNATKLGSSDLDKRKELIDQTLGKMEKGLEGVKTLVQTLEIDRAKKFGELSKQLENTAEQTKHLRETADALRSALASTKARGQWGERMAEDILRLCGLVEGINYIKQQKLESVGSKPDFTFLLPQNLKVNMDVKFPLNAYMQYLEAKTETDRKAHRELFLRDVRLRIKEVQTRDYINPAENTVDYVIVFIPNEQVYGFIQEQDSSIAEEAIKNKVILCSPLTLYAVLAVIRQAIDNFNLEKTSAQMLSLFGTFKEQWTKFHEAMDKMGKKIKDAYDEFDALATTRKRMLERPLDKIEELRVQKGIALEPIENTLEIPAPKTTPVSRLQKTNP